MVEFTKFWRTTVADISRVVKHKGKYGGGFFVRLSSEDRKVLSRWAASEMRNMTAQATIVLEKAVAGRRNAA